MAGQFGLQFRLPRKSQSSLTCRKSATWDGRLYIPSEGRHAVDFFALFIRRLRPGSNPLSWIPDASTLTTRLPKPLTCAADWYTCVTFRQSKDCAWLSTATWKHMVEYRRTSTQCCPQTLFQIIRHFHVPATLLLQKEALLLSPILSYKTDISAITNSCTAMFLKLWHCTAIFTCAVAGWCGILTNIKLYKQ
jgi:hypothetical protein